MLGRDMDRPIDLLPTLRIFAGLDAADRETVAGMARPIEAPAGTILVREGDAADTFYVIVSGTIRVERAGAFVRSLTAGGFLGEIGLLEERARTATAVCATDCELLAFGAEAFDRFLASSPDVRARIDAAMARRPRSPGSAA